MRFALRTTIVAAVLIAIAAGAALYRSGNVEAKLSGHHNTRTGPPGRLIWDATTGFPAVAPLTMNFVRSPDSKGADGKGRYLIAVNSGFGLEFTSKSKSQQTLSVIDLNKTPEPQVVQDLYFPAPQSANVGIVFDLTVQSNGNYRFYVSGGFENKIWTFTLDPNAAVPVAPANKPDEVIKAPFIDVSAFATNAPSPNYNDDRAAVYPVGIALSPNGETIYTANNLGDTLGVISDLRDTRRITRVPLTRPNSNQFVYPYDVKLLGAGREVAKAYVSLWGDGSIAVVNTARANAVSYITVGRHPTLMEMNRGHSRLYVVNSDGDSVSIIDTRTDAVVENINLRLAENARGMSPEGLALSEDEKTLYVTNAHANAVAVVQLASRSGHSKLTGFIPTGSYPSAVAVVGNRLFVANGKGTGMDNSSLHVNETGFYPNMPNKAFPSPTNARGMYSVAIVSGNISMVDVPDEKQLFAYTQAVMRNNGLLGRQERNIFPGGRSPFKHAIYVIRENRTYDQIFGDLEHAGDGNAADGDASVAIFGAGKAARSPNGEAQDITPNARALALRFGLFDRFFVNAEASPDGHNWSNAAFSSDYVDKAFRWEYGGRGRGYDYEGVNRLRTFSPPAQQPPGVRPPVTGSADAIVKFQKQYIPYYNGARDIAEPETLYLWDAAKRAGLSYRNYGEFIETVSADDVKEVNGQGAKTYPDVSPLAAAFPAKKSLEGHFAPQAANFDTATPDIMTTDSYRLSRSKPGVDPAIINSNPDPSLRGNSRFNAWVEEFHGYVNDMNSGKGDHLPNLSIVRLPSDHTAGLHRGTPTPQFYVADNDYALGRLVEEVSKSPYWADTAIFIVEDDAQDGPDHVDAHRSPALVISAYNRPGPMIHEFHSTVSLIRTLELCIGLAPMNFLDANATPMDIFTTTPDLRAFQAQMPKVALDNLYPPDKPNAAMAYYMQLTSGQDLSRADMADPQAMNAIIWYSVMHDRIMPGIARLPAFELMRQGIREEAKEEVRDRSAEE
jgi:YVTN family beta-propeller protein